MGSEMCIRDRARGANIYCEVLGYGASADASHITQPNETGEGSSKAMTNALANSRLNPEQVDYINAHGTSTPVGDAAETTAIKRVFGDHARRDSEVGQPMVGRSEDRRVC